MCYFILICLNVSCLVNDHVYVIYVYNIIDIVQFYMIQFSVIKQNEKALVYIYNDTTSLSCKRSVCDPLKLKMTPKVNYLGVTMTPENFFEGKTLGVQKYCLIEMVLSSFNNICFG